MMVSVNASVTMEITELPEREPAAARGQESRRGTLEKARTMTKEALLKTSMLNCVCAAARELVCFEFGGVA